MSIYSGGGDGKNKRIVIRFTPDEHKRIIKLLKKRRLTLQALGYAAVMRALNEADLGKRLEGEAPASRDEDQQETKPGLGIRDRLREDRERQQVEREEARDYRPILPPPVQQPAPRTTIDDEVLALARTIVESPQSTRREVWKAACHALARGRSQEEALRLGDDLDAAIKRIEAAPQTALDRVRARMGR